MRSLLNIRLSIPALLCLVVAAVLLSLSGCVTVGPDYTPPEVKTPTDWAAPGAEEIGAPSADEASLAGWWAVFEDPLLTSYVEEARRSNYDLRIAVARVDEARALLGVASGDKYPQVDAAADVDRNDPGGAGAGGPTTTYGLGVGIGWEVDLFGRIRRTVEAAAANLEASEEDRAAVQLAVTAEAARLYLVVRTAQARLASTLKNIKSQREIVDLTRTRFRHGLASDLDVAQSEQVLASSEADVPLFRSELQRAVHALGVLLGRFPDALSGELAAIEEIPLPEVEVALGVPADLLRRRPDIRRAERQLASQTARIGVATADLYPSLSLTGFIGLASVGSGNLFSSDSFAWQVAAPLRWKLFSGGRVRNQIRVEEARTEQALLLYEDSVLKALQEVEDALVAHTQNLERYAALQRSVEVAQRTLDLSLTLYKDGLRDFQSTLDAQRELFNAANLEAEARGGASTSLIQIYRALGGGWDPESEGSEGASAAAGP
jgi:NodT family efflux transporter outer membrane factor (OMF) lipoprotein